MLKLLVELSTVFLKSFQKSQTCVKQFAKGLLKVFLKMTVGFSMFKHVKKTGVSHI